MPDARRRSRRDPEVRSQRDWGVRDMFRRASRSAAAFAIVASVTAAVPVVAAGASSDEALNSVPDVRVGPEEVSGGDVPEQFVGVSIEWPLIDRYMGPAARPGFVNLLRNL